MEINGSFGQVLAPLDGEVEPAKHLEHREQGPRPAARNRITRMYREPREGKNEHAEDHGRDEEQQREEDRAQELHRTLAWQT
jgi:hypothetical protein